MNNRRVVLAAVGGHGSVLLDAMLTSDMDVLGIVDPARLVGSTVFSVPVLGSDEWLAQADPRPILLANGLGASTSTALRKRFFDKWTQKGFEFASVLHPSAVIGRETSLSQTCQVMAGAILQCWVKLGENTVVNTGASVDHGCQIASHAFVGPGVTLCGDVQVGEGAFIGAGATVKPGIRIGSYATVAAGSMVITNIADGQVVAGNPAKEIVRRAS